MKAKRSLDLDKIGIIDLGSNSARLVIVQVLDDGHFMVVDQLKESVRLGKDMERDGFLKPQRVAETIKTLKMFRKLCDAYGIERIVAVATAAVRRAKNQKSFLDEVATSCGIKLKVLSAEEEAMFVYRGIINTMDIPKGLILEVSGGSTKVIYYNRRNLLNFTTLPFGAITLTELYSGDGLSGSEQVEKIEEFFVEQLKNIEWLKDIDPETQIILVGGSFRSLGRITKILRKSPYPIVHNFVVPETDFDVVYDKLKNMDLDKKKRIKGVSTSRADILPSALAVANTFRKYCGFKEFVLAGGGLREGIMFNHVLPSTLEKPVSDVLTYSLKTLVKYYNCNEKHVEQVLTISVQLFKQLRVLHKFPRQVLKVLKVAAMLHDAGASIKYYDYQKHSSYICLNSALYGISQRDIVLAALVISVYKNDDFSMNELIKFKEFITEEDVVIIRKLGIILRIAESLDRSMSGCVKSISCDVLGDAVIMKTEIDGDASLEIKEAMTAGQDFRRIFKKNLDIL